MIEKSISIHTDYNKKLNCPCFIHIDFAPASPIHESVKDNTVIEIKTTDNSHHPVKVMLDDLARIELKNITALITWQSHGMGLEEFKQWVIKQNPKLTPETKMAVYLYKKISE